MYKDLQLSLENVDIRDKEKKGESRINKNALLRLFFGDFAHWAV